MRATVNRDYSLLVGSYSNLDVLAHQPYAPVPGKGIYAMTLTRGGALRLNDVTEALNPAVLIPHSDGRTLYAICETIRDEGTVLRYTVNPDGTLTYHDTFHASGRPPTISLCRLARTPRSSSTIRTPSSMSSTPTRRAGSALSASLQQHYRPDGTWRQVVDREDHSGSRQDGRTPTARISGTSRSSSRPGENTVFQYRYDPDARHLTHDSYIPSEPAPARATWRSTRT